MTMMEATMPTITERGTTMPKGRAKTRTVVQPVSDEIPEIKEGELNQPAVGAYLARLREHHGWGTDDAVEALHAPPYSMRFNRQGIWRIDRNNQTVTWPLFISYLKLLGADLDTIVDIALNRQMTTAQAAAIADRQWKQRIDRIANSEVKTLLQAGVTPAELRAALEEIERTK